MIKTLFFCYTNKLCALASGHTVISATKLIVNRTSCWCLEWRACFFFVMDLCLTGSTRGQREGAKEERRKRFVPLWLSSVLWFLSPAAFLFNLFSEPFESALEDRYMSHPAEESSRKVQLERFFLFSGCVNELWMKELNLTWSPHWYLSSLRFSITMTFELGSLLILDGVERLKCPSLLGDWIQYCALASVMFTVRSGCSI